jgi:phosphatidylglycerol:prolipoprotein diacylglycerol transferase
MTNHYIHDFNSIAFHWGDIIFPWYWLVYLLGYFWVFQCLEYLSKKNLISLNQADIYLYMTRGFVGMLLGARLTYIFLYNFSYYLADPKKVYYLWEGGMSFHGAMLGVGLSILWISKKRKQSFFEVIDPICLAIPLVLGFGRLANFMNGELAGRVSDVPWAIIFPKFYDMTPRHPSQIYQALSEGFLLFAILWISRAKLKLRARVTSYFMIGYGLFRFATEYFRQPDKQLGLFFLELSMGQMLCFIMVLIGLWVWKYSRRLEKAS